MYYSRMSADFARWYLWAKTIQQNHPADSNAQLLVRLLRHLHDLSGRAAADPANTPDNLTAPIQESIELLVTRLVAAYPGEAPLE
jgi:hypothetical protein